MTITEHGTNTNEPTTSAAVRLRIWLQLAVAAVLASVSSFGATPVGATNDHDGTAIWIGAPVVTSTWPNTDDCWRDDTYPSAWCSLPYAHHTYNYGDTTPGDWGIDIQSVAVGKPVVLYAAPVDTSQNNRVTARVKKVTLACGSAYTGESVASRAARGGYAVVVELLHDNNSIGTVKYVHVNPTVRQGQTISRWGPQVGTVGSYTKGTYLGSHPRPLRGDQHPPLLVLQPGLQPGQRMDATNFMGFVGGHYAYNPRTACP